jgi:hypothetical protein
MYFGNDPFQLAKEINDVEKNLSRLKETLRVVQAQCRHSWAQPEYTPIITEGFEYGDEPGTMGSDYIPKHWVPRQESPRWTRICINCGLKQETTHTKEDVRKVPVF